jgi:hypothetical protein
MSRHTRAAAVLTAAAAFVLFAVPALAAPSVHRNVGQELNAAQCNSGGSPVLNVTYKVVRDADSGIGGNAWAYDNYTKRIQVWQQPDGTFCAVEKTQGQFVTTAGQSPGYAYTGGYVDAGVKGTFEGGYTATFSGQLNTDLQAKGNIGTVDYNCDTSFNCPGYFDWLTTYFGSLASATFSYNFWGWNYHAGKNGSWVNASTGNSGDITGS